MDSYGKLDTESGIVDGLINRVTSVVHDEQLQLFGQFIGSWSIRWRRRGSKSDLESNEGEVHFDWILDGQAVQDTWIVPPSGELGGTDLDGGCCGTTVRFYDPSFDTWRCVWVEPSKRQVRQFFGWSQDGDIMLFSDDETPYVRWCFTDISSDSFVILRERSHDSGSTWEIGEEMRLNRIVGT